MDQILPNAVLYSSLVFTPSLASLLTPTNKDTIDKLHADSATLVTDKLSTTYVGSTGSVGTSKATDLKVDKLMQINNTIDVGSHTSKNNPSILCSPSISSSSHASKCRHSVLKIPSVTSFPTDPTGSLTSPIPSQLHSVSDNSNKKPAPHAYRSARLGPLPQPLVMLSTMLYCLLFSKASSHRSFA